MNIALVRHLIGLMRMEKLFYRFLNPYTSFVPDRKKSVQENAGYSKRAEINEVLEKSATDLVKSVSHYCKPGDNILDLGCGPGMYLRRFEPGKYRLTGTDINAEMLNIIRAERPEAETIQGNFIDLKLSRQFRFIYCIGVLVYIPRSMLKPFIKKVYESLEQGGIFYLNYPHALSFIDAVFPDPSYTQYSPRHLERAVSQYFTVLSHAHAFDGRQVGLFDRKPYKSLNPETNRTYKNSYLMVAQKNESVLDTHK